MDTYKYTNYIHYHNINCITLYNGTALWETVQFMCEMNIKVNTHCKNINQVKKM